MCGIFGTTRELKESLASSILGLLDHRGPDSNGLERVSSPQMGGSVTLLHTRLAIQDLSASGHQPMVSNDKRWWITYNGELYNHLELRQKLTHSFRGTSDTETLLEYLAVHGINKTLEDINGMYALAVLDTREGILYLARDPFGIKPLYYRKDNDGLTFSSELKPILACSETQPQISQPALGLFLDLRYVPSPTTMIENISRLQPGHYLEFNLGNSSLKVKPFIKATFDRFTGSITDAVDSYHEQLSLAVKRQLISDVPVGVLLSAGIDSALIAALAREQTSDLTAHTVGFGSQFDECEIAGAAETAKILNIPHDVTTVNPELLIDSLADIVSAVEEPLGTTSIMPMWYLTKLARENAIVVLSGQGNDEPWGGYRRYQIELLLQSLPLFKSSPFRFLGRLATFTSNDSLRRGLKCVGYDNDATRFANAYALFSDDELNLLGFKPIEGPDPIEYWLDLLAKNKGISPAEKMMKIDSRMNLADDLLLYSDKVAMSCALEVRVPMLDPNVVRFVENLPLSFRTSLRRTKIVHRKMAEDYLPRKIIERPKKGFQVPFGLWCKTIWRDYMHAHLLDPHLKISSVLDNKGIRTIWNHHESGKFDYSRQLFALLTLSLWMERYLTSYQSPSHTT